MTTVLLTGGSGFVGHWVARHLPPTTRLRLLARPTSDLSRLERAAIPFERVEGDLRDAASLRAALAGADALIHAAGWISFDRQAAARVRAANLDGSVTLFEAALAVGTPRVVQVGSIFGLGHAGAGAAWQPGSPFNGDPLLNIPYLNAKRAVELRAEALLERGLPLVRLYPGLCLGPEDDTRSSSGLIGAWLRGQLPALVRGGICYVDVRDAAAGLVAALERGEVGRRYLLTGTNLTHRQLFERLGALLGRRPPVTLPAPLALLGARALLRLWPATPLLPDLVRLMRYRWWYDDRADRAALGLRLRPLDETLRATLAALEGAEG